MGKATGEHIKRYWELLPDEQLLDAEFTTDDPEGLEGLARAVPPGDDEPYVEYKYDLRGSDREMLHCVHGNHAHLSGFVMRKGAQRFLVGRICGNHIYGETFDAYTADFNAAVNRQDALRRSREIERATKPFVLWIGAAMQSPVFAHYRSVRERIGEHLPWIFDNVPRMASVPSCGVKFPTTLFADRTDPEAEFKRAAAEFSVAIQSLVAKPEVSMNLDPIRKHFELVIRRIEGIIDQLKEIEDFFQPAVLSAVCALANEHDNPKKRRYIPGLLSITCKRSKNDIVVSIPRSFQLPDRKALDDFRAALKGVASPVETTPTSR